MATATKTRPTQKRSSGDSQEKPHEQNGGTNGQTNRPFQVLRRGLVKAVIWMNQTANGPMFSTQLIRVYKDGDLEKLFTFVRFLVTKLPRRNTGPQYDFDDDVTLKFYRLQKISEGSITLSPGEAGVVTGPTAVGTGNNEDPTVELSRLIDIINDKFGTDFKPADELFFNQIREEAVANEELVQSANANTKENFRFVFQKALEGLFIDRMEQNEELFAKYMNDGAFRKLVDEHLLTQVYDHIREQPTPPTAG